MERALAGVVRGVRVTGIELSPCASPDREPFAKPGKRDATEDEARVHEPKVVRVDAQNRIVSMTQEIPGPQMPPAIA